MKTFKWLLTLSVLANVIFAFVVIGRAGRRAEAAAAVQSPATPTASAAVAVSQAKADAARPSVAVARGGRLWAELQSASYRDIVRRLEEAGFPRRLIVAIVTGISGERMRKQFGELSRETRESQPYWKANQYLGDDPAKRAAWLKLQTEEQAQLTAALGPDFWLTEERALELARERYGELPTTKLRALNAIESDYREMQRKAFQDAESPASEWKLNGDKARLLEAERRADIVKLLSPEELFEYDLRSSLGAEILRTETGFLELSEQEFRTMFPAYQTAAERLLAMKASSPDEQIAVEAGFQAELREKVQALLGPERFADYLQAKDPASKKLNLIVQRLELPLSAARAVVTVQNDVTQRADAIRLDKTLAPDKRAAQLAALVAEAKTRITGSLGERGYAAYLENSGKWLRNLQPATPGSKP